MQYIPQIKKWVAVHNWLPEVLYFMGVLVAFWFLNIIIRKILRFILRRTKLDEVLIKIIVDDIIWLGIWAIGLIVAFNYIGINIYQTLAGIGIVGVAIGFAAKDSLASFVAGLNIFWDKPFQVGEWIEVEGRIGQVKNITIRSTRIRTLDNIFVVIPNQIIANSSLINHSAEGATRLKIAVQIGYREPVEEARDILLGPVGEFPAIIKNPAPDVVVRNLAESGVELQLRVWIKDMSQEQHVRYGLQERMLKSLNDANIEIPYPHRAIIMKK